MVCMTHIEYELHRSIIFIDLLPHTIWTGCKAIRYQDHIRSAASTCKTTNTDHFFLFLTMMLSLSLFVTSPLQYSLFVTCTEFTCRYIYRNGFFWVGRMSNVTIFPPRTFLCHTHVCVSINFRSRLRGCSFCR